MAAHADDMHDASLSINRPTEINRAVARLCAALEECREYLEDRMDVYDGDYGIPRPNREMQLVQMIDEVIGRQR